MPVLWREASGLIYRNTFDDPTLGPGWHVSPIDPSRYSLTDRPGWLRLKHGSVNLMMLRAAPESGVLECDNEYNPAAPDDEGGLMAFIGQDEYAKLAEHFDVVEGTAQAWPHLRLVKQGAQIQAYASEDGATWHLRGAVKLSNVGLWGLFLDFPSGQVMDVDEVRIYAATTITVSNLSEGMIVRLFDQAETVVAEAATPAGSMLAALDVAHLRFPFSGTLRVYHADETLYGELAGTDFWGGDRDRADYMPALEDSAGNPIEDDVVYNLGALRTDPIEDWILLRNDTPATLVGLSVAVAQYNGEFGWEWVDVAPDAGGVPGVYGDEVTIGNLGAGSTAKVWYRVTRSEVVLGPDDVDVYRFRIEVRKA